MKQLCNTSLHTIKDDFTTWTFSVSLTSDIWSGWAKQDYIRVVVHYVNKNWELQKRIIGFELIDESHTVKHIAQDVLNIVIEFGLPTRYLQ